MSNVTVAVNAAVLLAAGAAAPGLQSAPPARGGGQPYRFPGAALGRRSQPAAAESLSLRGGTAGRGAPGRLLRVGAVPGSSAAGGAAFSAGCHSGVGKARSKAEGREKPSATAPLRSGSAPATPRHGRPPLRSLRAGALRLAAGAGRRVLGWCRLRPERCPCGPPAGRMLESGCKAVKEGVLEKRSDGLLQLWKKKRCILTEEGLLLAPPKQPPPPQQQQQPPPAAPSTEPTAKIKELHFSNMKTVDCVERKGKYVYFTVVMAEGKEIDFRCAQEQGWNAAITLQMVQYKNRQAILAVRSTRQKQQHLAQQPHGPRLRSASNSA